VLKEEECLDEAVTRIIRKQSASLAHDDDDGRQESTARLGSVDGGREVIALVLETSRRDFRSYAAIDETKESTSSSSPDFSPERASQS
jgi:hypothetical protein